MSTDYQNFVKELLEKKAEISSKEDPEDFYFEEDLRKFNRFFSESLYDACKYSEKVLAEDLNEFKKTSLKRLRDDFSCWKNFGITTRPVKPADLVKKIDEYLAEH